MTLPRQTTWAPRWFVLLVAGLFSLSLSVILFSGGAAAAFPSNHDSAVSAYEGPSRLSPVARGELAAIVGADHSWRANRGAGPKASGSVAVSGFVVAAKAGSGRLSTVLKSGERGAIGRGLSPNQMNRAINRGQGPSGITRIDTPKIPHEKLHATFEDGSALNVDGTWKHGGLDLTRDQSSWLVENGWTLP